MILLHNEFASVTAEVRHRRGRTRLRLVDTKTGVGGELDPIVLEALAWASDEELEAFTLAVLRRTTRLGDETPACAGGDPARNEPAHPTEP